MSAGKLGLDVDLLAVDLDGTLVDSAPDIAHCTGRALEAAGFAPPSEALVRAWIGDGIEILISRALAHATRSAEHRGEPQRGGTADEHAAALRAFLACYEQNLFVRSRLYPQALATLDALRARGIRLACVTNKRFAFSEKLLTDAGVLDRFELLLGGDSLPEKKPSPLPLLTAAKTLGVDPAAAALVGDSHQDLRAAKAAGFGFVWAAYGYGKVDQTEVGAAPRLREFAELEPLLTS